MSILRRGWPAIFCIALCLGYVGCSSEPEPKQAEEEEAPPPPPTPEEIANKIVTDLGLNAPLPASGARLAKEASDKMKTVARQAKNVNSATPEGKRALQIVSRRVDQRIGALEQAGAWDHALATIEVYEILNDGSHKWDTTKQTAMAELTKPKVTIVGFWYDGTTDQNAALLEFYLPISRETKRERVRVGEEFYGLKLTEIIGKNQGVRLEYKETGKTYDVLTASASQ